MERGWGREHRLQVLRSPRPAGERCALGGGMTRHQPCVRACCWACWGLLLGVLGMPLGLLGFCLLSAAATAARSVPSWPATVR